jgi:hypothetical protein
VLRQVGLSPASLGGLGFICGLLAGCSNAPTTVARDCNLVSDIVPTLAGGAVVRNLADVVRSDEGSPQTHPSIDCADTFARRGIRVLSNPKGPAVGDVAVSQPVYDDAHHAKLIVIHYGRMGEQIRAEKRGAHWVVTERSAYNAP